MVRDLQFSAETEPAEAWTLLARRVSGNGQATFEIEDSSPPQQDGARLYLLADGNLDGDGMADVYEVEHGYDPQRPDHPDVEFRVFTPLH